MNYIGLINHFWALNKEYSFTAYEKAVYFALLNKANELAWKNPFNQSNESLALDADMSVPALIRARKTLQEKKLINFISGAGRRNNTEYFLFQPNEKGAFKITLSDTFSEGVSVPFSVPFCDENGLHNNKLETKLNKTKTQEENENFSKKVFGESGGLNHRCQTWFQQRVPSYEFDHLQHLYLKGILAKLRNSMDRQQKAKGIFYKVGEDAVFEQFKTFIESMPAWVSEKNYDLGIIDKLYNSLVGQAANAKQTPSEPIIRASGNWFQKPNE